MPHSRLVRSLTGLVFAMFFVAWSIPGNADIVNHGPAGEYFQDTTTGLYWMDPSLFYGDYRASIDRLATCSDVWSWATSAQIDALVGESTDSGTLEITIGGRITTIANGGPRWLGFHSGTDPDGWLIESNNTPDFDSFTTSGYQGGAASMGAGAWLVSSADPVVACHVLENVSGGAYFHDLATDLYWSDPGAFYGSSREEVETWLAGHSAWRWATYAEIMALLGKCTTDGSTLESILGTRLTTIGNGGPRWVGFHSGTSPDGVILQSGKDPGFYMFDDGGYQGGAASMGCGAWIVSDVDPTSTDTRSWGEIKQLFR